MEERRGQVLSLEFLVSEKRLFTIQDLTSSVVQ